MNRASEKIVGWLAWVLKLPASQPGAHALIRLAVVLAVSLTLAPLAAQQAGGTYRIGWLAPEASPRNLDAFRNTLHARRTEDIDRAFAVAVRERVAVVTRLASALFNAERTRLVSLAAKHRRPAMYENRAFPEDGGLMLYGPDLQEVFRRVAVFVDRILKGAKPADLPVEQPTKFELIVNLKTAKALGLTIPQTLLLQANQVIESPVLDPRGQLPACCCRLRRILQCCRTTAPCTASARGWIRGLVLGTLRSGCPPRLRPAIDSVRRARLAGNFYTTGMEHSPTSATGTGWKRTP
jgi:hypothetical protein